MYSCPLHQWNSHDSPCPSCATTVTTGGDLPIMVVTQTPMTRELKSELRSLTYKGAEVTILYHFYKDSQSGQQYTTTELDEINIAHVHYAYNSKTSLLDELRKANTHGFNSPEDLTWCECCNKLEEIIKSK